jgi:hypothetical protein
MGQAVTVPENAPDRPDDVAAEHRREAGEAEARPERPPTRPLVERLGLGFIALVAAALFGAMSAAAWAGGELFLAVMAGIGLVMTVWAAATTVFRA